MWIKNAWYVAAWASEVAPDALLARIILGIPVVLYRTQDGEAVALEDRCGHRLAPLSKGRLEGSELRCMYHGIKFGPTGECVEIPGETATPKNMKVQSFPLVEKNKLLWIWVGEAALADPADIVDIPHLDSPDWRYSEGFIHYDANYKLIADNLLDFTHLAYVHEKTFGTNMAGEVRPEVELTDFGIHLSYLWNNDEAPPMIKNAGGFAGKIDRWNLCAWHVRGNMLLMDAGSMAPGAGGHASGREGAIQFRHVSIQTPECENTTNYFFCHAHDFGIDDDKIAAGIWDTVCAAFEEDRDIIEAQQRSIDLDPSQPMTAAPFDGPLIHIRGKIDAVIAAEQAEQAEQSIAAE
jgi:phenylpropionate dioxygenase-like ring-hydroxylating dioxygenase large terminal subunit